MSWAMYGHLPAWGMGERDPRRPYVTGGLGGGVFIVVPGPAGYIVLILGTPNLWLVKAIIPDANLELVLGVGQADLTWVRALQQVQPAIAYIDSVRSAELVFVQADEVGLWEVRGPFTPSVSVGLILTALTGVEAVSLDSEIMQVSDLQADVTGVFDADYDPELYAGKVLSSQES